MASNIPWAAPKELSLDGNVSENYRKFIEHWSLFEKAELKDKSEEDKCSYFLVCIREKAREVYHTFDLPPEPITNDKGETTWTRTIQELRTAFQNYCNPRKNITFERHKLKIRNQEQGETIDQYATELRKLASTCEFKDLRDGLIRDRVICGINNRTIRERLLRESDLTLEKALDICRASEHSKQQMKTISGTHNPNIDALKRRTGRNFANVTESPQVQANNRRTPCGNCGTYHKPRSCPAYSKQCANCSRLGHFAKFCRSTQRQQSRNSQPRVFHVDYDPYETDDSERGIAQSTQ
ncbi:uncharacterized protein LOC122956251 [Acropora millepora]|uniref:uncharacterized protein LOC122956251 n=1 Tax=Acropora millepora TaxID=45264 RepID=UPI001CF2B134|nr:uncharacterized protein LOC122956251 [Acropora millepora]